MTTRLFCIAVCGIGAFLGGALDAQEMAGEGEGTRYVEPVPGLAEPGPALHPGHPFGLGDGSPLALSLTRGPSGFRAALPLTRSHASSPLTCLGGQSLSALPLTPPCGRRPEGRGIDGVLPEPLAAPFPQFAPGEEDGPTWRHRILTAVGGALVGMGVGYFASEVALSDWNEGSGGQQVDRPVWAAVGGGLGFAVGFSFPITGGGQPGVGSLGGGRSVITGEEMTRLAATTALEVVRLLRPEWLIERGQEDFYDPEGDNIRVYMDDSDLGGVEMLAEISTAIIESIRFIDPGRASARWGYGHTQGVIQVITNQ